MSTDITTIAEMMLYSRDADSVVLGLDACTTKIDGNAAVLKQLNNGIALCDDWLKAYEIYYLKPKIGIQELGACKIIEPYIKTLEAIVPKEHRKEALEKVAGEFKDAKKGLTDIISSFNNKQIISKENVKKYIDFFERISMSYLSYVASSK